MKATRAITWLTVVALLVGPVGVQAQNIFRKPMAEYLKAKKVLDVSCKACHPPENNKDKKLRNDFGKLFEKALAGKNITKRIADAKDNETTDKVYPVVVKEFMEALKKVEKMKYPGGGTYGEAMRKNKIEHIKLPQE